MNIPKELINDAKERIGERAAEIIAAGLNLNKWDQRNLKGCCPLHNEKTPSFAWNKKGNYFKCFGCGGTYDIIDYFTDGCGYNFIEAAEAVFNEAGMKHDFENSIVKSYSKKKDYKYPKAELGSQRREVEKYLRLRGISKETLDYAGIKQDVKGNIVFEYKDQFGNLLLVKYRPSRKVMKGESKLWCQQGADTTPLLYGMDKINPTKPLLICEGEIDRLSAIEAGFKNVVSVPFGAGNYTWIDHNWEWLLQFEKIIIWADSDEAGDKMRREVLPRLGEYRCYCVNSEYKDINICLYREGKEKVLKSIEEAKEIPISYIVDLAEVEDFDINRAEKIKSGYNALDKWISGFILGTVDIITGYNSSGKSTLINQMCIVEPMEQGYKTFIFSGELTKQQLRNWIEFPLAGPHYVHEFDNGPNQPKGYAVYKEAKTQMREWYKGKVYIYNNDEDYRAKSILDKMRELAMRYGIKNFVIDNLMVIDLECSESEKYTKQKEFVRDLKNFAKQYHSVVHLIAHPRKGDGMKRLNKMDVAGSGDITNLVDYVLSIYRVPPKEKETIYDKSGNVEQEGYPYDAIIDLHKNRFLGHQDKVIGLNFDIVSKRFYGSSDNLNKKYGWENLRPLEMVEVVNEKFPWD